jgi:hypothetical protein
VTDRDKSEDQRAITVERVRDKSNSRCERYSRGKSEDQRAITAERVR